jgi:hypothetical protein
MDDQIRHRNRGKRGTRHVRLWILSPALGRYAMVRLLLPRRFSAEPDRRGPVRLLLERRAGREPPGGGRAVHGRARGDGLRGPPPGHVRGRRLLQRPAAHPLPGRPGPRPPADPTPTTWRPACTASACSSRSATASRGRSTRRRSVEGPSRPRATSTRRTSPSSSGCASSASLSGRTTTVPAPTTPGDARVTLRGRRPGPIAQGGSACVGTR